MKHVRVLLWLAGSSALAACSDEPLAPAAERARGIELAAASAPLASLGDTAIVSPRIVDRDGKPIRGVPLKWSVRPAGIVQQDGEGIFRAIGNGRAIVVAEIDPGDVGVRPSGYWAGRFADSVMIEVHQRPARLALAPADTAFGTIGAGRQLRALVTDARGNAMLEPPTLLWQSADPGVVVVDGAGLVHSVGEGSARVSVQVEALIAAATFRVQPRLPHTSCMVYSVRRQERENCVTLEFIMHEREARR